MPYGLSRFIEDCRSALRSDPGPKGREQIRVLLERLLKDRDFLAAHCSESTPKGLHLLHDDAELGFQVLAHINEKARGSPPHDHGASWAIYGQAVSHTDMTEYRRVDGGADPAKAALEVTRKYRLNPGEAGIFADGAIHSIDYPDGSQFVRITGTNLDRIARSSFDLRTGAVKQMAAQRAT
jgi:predicted metal-dependent enzyme (double-stranded beta helix superfamily)